MEVVLKEMKKQGWKVEDVHKEKNRLYDFVFKKQEKLIYCEVKGTQNSDAKVILTKNEQENIKFWNIRESIPLAEKKENFVIKHDVSIPLERMEQFINETDQKLKKNFSAEIINFGHIGDNNLHYNVSVSKNMKPNEENRVLKKVNDIVYSHTTKFG